MNDNHNHNPHADYTSVGSTMQIVIAHGLRHGRTRYLNALKEQAERHSETPVISTKDDETTEIAIDECKEITVEDFKRIRNHPLLGKVEGSIQTDKNDWFYRFTESRFVEEDHRGE